MHLSSYLGLTIWGSDGLSFSFIGTHFLLNSAPHDGASVLACAYQLKVRSQNPKDFEHWFSQRLWVKFAMFLLNSTSEDAGAIIGARFLTRAQNIPFI